MIIDRSQLKELFANGSLPSGGDFGELIDSLAHKTELYGLQGDFESWTTQGEITLGADGDRWRLYVDRSGRLCLERDAEQGAGSAPANLQLEGWVSLVGRLGGSEDAAAFTGRVGELDTSVLPSVPGDGKWHSIVQMPGHVCAFEVLAVTTTELPLPPPSLGSFLSRLVGWRRASNSIVHAVASANGSPDKPEIRRLQNPSPMPVWQLVLWLVGVAGVALFTVGADLGLPDGWFETPLTAGVVLALSVALLRSALRVWCRRRDRVQVKWVTAGGSWIRGDRSWELKLRGPALDGGARDNPVSYQITRLWN